MEVRTETLCSFLLSRRSFNHIRLWIYSAVQIPNVVPPAGATRVGRCGTAEPPPVQHNLYLGADIPAIILSNPQIQRRTQGDTTIQTAQRRYQAGKRSYQAGDVATARREFDRAIDMMLEASDQGLIDRQQYERQLDEMVDQIHRLDLAEFGAAAAWRRQNSKRRPSKIFCR